VAARLIAPVLAESLGQQVIIDNRGGSVVIPAQAVAKAPPDGYTLLLYNNSLWTLPLMQELPFDPIANFAPISLAVSMPSMLVVHPSLPARSVKELIAFAKAKPGQLNYGSGSMGGATHLSAELFNAMAGVKIVLILYKGGGAALTDLMGGQVQVAFPTASSVVPFVKSGRLRALALTSSLPSALYPGLPTMAASGLPDYEATSISGIFAPEKTPQSVINRLNREIVQILNRPDVKDRFHNTGTDVVASSAEEFSIVIKSEMARMGAIIKKVGIRAE
jgi:tripartite-type tricarboxylate transporter receptor subunit TctC